MPEILGPMPPYVQLFELLSESEHQRVLDWALSNRDHFSPAGVTKMRFDDAMRQVDPQQRIALTTRKLGPLAPMLRERLLGALSEVMARTGTSGPQPTSLELELAAHGDGAFYMPHLDIPVGANRTPLSGTPGEDRVLSAVYYFYGHPKAFSGGELRLYRFGAVPTGSGAEPANHVDLEPVRNSLVAFASWVRHEVRRVSCPSGNFRDYRFALNCWYCRALAPTSHCTSES